MAPYFSTLAWNIPWMEEPGVLQSMGSLRVGHDWAASLSLFTFMHWRRKMATHSSVLAWRIPGMGEPGGLPSMGSHRVGHDWRDLAAAAAVGIVGKKWGSDDYKVQGFFLESWKCSKMIVVQLKWLHSFVNKPIATCKTKSIDTSDQCKNWKSCT